MDNGRVEIEEIESQRWGPGGGTRRWGGGGRWVGGGRKCYCATCQNVAIAVVGYIGWPLSSGGWLLLLWLPVDWLAILSVGSIHITFLLVTFYTAYGLSISYWLSTVFIAYLWADYSVLAYFSVDAYSTGWQLLCDDYLFPTDLLLTSCMALVTCLLIAYHLLSIFFLLVVHCMGYLVSLLPVY